MLMTILRCIKYIYPFIREIFDHTKEDTRISISRTIIVVLLGTALLLVGYVYSDQRIDYLEKELLSYKSTARALEHNNATLELKLDQVNREFHERGATIASLNKALEICRLGRESDAEIFRSRLLQADSKHTLPMTPKLPKAPKPKSKPPVPTPPTPKKTPGRLEGIE